MHSDELIKHTDESIKHTNLYVSGLSKNITKEEFDNAFKGFGTIVSSKVMFDTNTGFGFL